MTKPQILIDEEIREMTDDEYNNYFRVIGESESSRELDNE
jgi:hypothetical protein